MTAPTRRGAPWRAEDHAPLGLEGGGRVAGGGGKDCREGSLQLRAEQGQLAGLWPSMGRARELKPEPQVYLIQKQRGKLNCARGAREALRGTAWCQRTSPGLFHKGEVPISLSFFFHKAFREVRFIS